VSFQATEWARSLPLHSGSAKFTLMMIGSYADTEDCCFPKLARLAADTLQSVATVRRRIRELEQLGALTRFARWSSPDGQVVVTQASVKPEDRPLECRQTSDLLRLNLRLTADDVRAKISALGWDKPRQKGDDDADSGEGDDRPDSDEGCQSATLPPGANLEPPGLQGCETPGVSPGSHPLNSNSKTYLNQNPQSPLSPECESAGLAREENDLAVQHAINRFGEAYPIPITNLPLVRQLLAAMTPDEREQVIIAAFGYRAFVREQDRRAMDAHRFIRDGKWPGFVDKGRATMPKPPPQEFPAPAGGPLSKALAMARAISRGPEQLMSVAGALRDEVLRWEPPRGLLALAPLFDQIGPWMPVVENSRRWHAWRERLAECRVSMPKPRRLRLISPEERDREGRIIRLAEFERGGLFPCGWPPSKGDRAETTGPPNQQAAE